MSKQRDSVALVRKHLRITQAAMGRLLGVHPQTVSDWERGGDSIYPTTGSATTLFAESQHAADTRSGEAEPDTNDRKRRRFRHSLPKIPASRFWRLMMMRSETEPAATPLSTETRPFRSAAKSGLRGPKSALSDPQPTNSRGQV